MTEFANRGFDGARIETIVREGGYNKALVYRYFGTKEGLFRAALRHKLDERLKVLRNAPRELAETMYYFFSETLRDREYIRMLIGEAMHRDGAPVVDEPWRREYYRRHTELVERVQQKGNLPRDVDPAFLMILITSIVVFPAVMPQMAKLLTGVAPDSREFHDRWKAVTEVFAEHMRQPDGQSDDTN